MILRDVVMHYLMIAAVLGIFVALLWNCRKGLNRPETWMMLFCVIFVSCCGGAVYDIVNGVPMYESYSDRDGKPMLELFSSEGQYAGEGFLASLLG